MRVRLFLVTGIIALTHFSSYSQQPTVKPEVLTNKSIIDLHKAGIDEDLIVAKIQSSECKFDLSTNGMIDLKNKGVPSSLIKVMMNKADGKPLNYSGGENTNPSTLPSNKNKNAAAKSDYSSLEMLNYVYTWSKSGQPAKPLEKLTATVRHQPGLITAFDNWHLEGLNSTVRLNAADASTFVVNTGNSTPPDLVLYKLKSAKDGREAIYVKGNMSGNKASPDMISVNITKLADGIYQVAPVGFLKKGEYFFTTRPATTELTSTEAYAFGID